MSEKSLGKNALLNGIKTACSILFPFISFAYCSRVLGKENLGKYSFGQSIIAYLLLVAALGIPNYAIREGAGIRDDKKNINKFINQVFTINCIMTIVSYVILMIVLSIPRFANYKYILLIQSLQILLTTLGTDWINTIYEDYFYLAVRYIAIQVISLLALILFIKSPSNLYVYTLISTLSNSGGNILNWHYLRKHGIRPRLTINIQFHKHIKPILILFGNSIASVIYLNSDITMLGLLTNDATVGVYTVATKVYSMMKTLINGVIMVTLPRFSFYIKKGRFEEYKKNLTNIADVLMMISLPVMIGLFLEPNRILLFIAGSEYLSGSNVVRVYSFAILFAVFACFYAYAILLPNKLEKYFLLSTIIAAIINISLNFVLIPFLGMLAAALTTLIAEIVVFFISYHYSRKCITYKIKIKNIGKYLLGCSAVTILCLLCDQLNIGNTLTLIIEIVFSTIVYVAILMLSKCDSMIYLIRMIRRNTHD